MNFAKKGKSEVTKINKGKVFNISFNIAYFSEFFLQSFISTSTMHCVNCMVFWYLALKKVFFFSFFKEDNLNQTAFIKFVFECVQIECFFNFFWSFIAQCRTNER